MQSVKWLGSASHENQLGTYNNNNNTQSWLMRYENGVEQQVHNVRPTKWNKRRHNSTVWNRGGGDSNLPL